MVSFPETSKTAEQQVDRRADGGPDVLLRPSPQRVHLHHVHRRQETCGASTGVQVRCLEQVKLRGVSTGASGPGGL